MAYGLIICGLFWFIFGLIQNTRNFKSAVLYRIIPAVSGVYAFIAGILMLN